MICKLVQTWSCQTCSVHDLVKHSLDKLTDMTLVKHGLDRHDLVKHVLDMVLSVMHEPKSYFETTYSRSWIDFQSCLN